VLETLQELLTKSPAFALLVIFWIGAVTSLSSCTAVRLPIVLGYVGASTRSRKRSLILTALFLIGLVVSYVLIGAAAGFMGDMVHQLLNSSKVIFWACGASLLIAGALTSGLLGPGVLSGRRQRIAAWLDRARGAGALVFGVFFGLLTMPACPLCGAGLIVLAGFVAAKGLSLYGLAMFASFALGQGLPLVAVGVLTTILGPGLVDWVRTRLCSAEEHAQLFYGNLLMVLGIYFIVVG
jgi:cytochrome c biogenesis protein CcdA